MKLIEITKYDNDATVNVINVNAKCMEDITRWQEDMNDEFYVRVEHKIHIFEPHRTTELNRQHKPIRKLQENFQRGRAGEGRGRAHCVSPSYLHGPLQMFGPVDGVCNYLHDPALEKFMAY